MWLERHKRKKENIGCLITGNLQSPPGDKTNIGETVTEQQLPEGEKYILINQNKALGSSETGVSPCE